MINSYHPIIENSGGLSRTFPILSILKQYYLHERSNSLLPRFYDHREKLTLYLGKNIKCRMLFAYITKSRWGGIFCWMGFRDNPNARILDRIWLPKWALFPFRYWDLANITSAGVVCEECKVIFNIEFHSYPVKMRSNTFNKSNEII